MQEQDYRLFNCAMCDEEVVICNYCDRGNIYCGPKCSSITRKQSLQKAGKIYQDSYKGRVTHADRQQRYRENQVKIKKVTHQGSQPPSSNDLLLSKVNVANIQGQAKRYDAPDCCWCHFCGRSCCKTQRTLTTKDIVYP